MNSTQEIISAATGVDSITLPVLERIIREDIYHGPLDWQSVEELETAAKEALAIYGADKEFHDADTRFRKTRWTRVLAERAASEYPTKQSLRNSLNVAYEAEQKALRDLQSFTLSTPK